MLVPASMVENPSLARVNPVVLFNKFAGPNLRSVLRLFWPEELTKSEAKFNKKSEAD